MADTKWEVIGGKLVYSTGGSSAVTISGGLNTNLTAAAGSLPESVVSKYFGTITDPSGSTSGVITLKKAALGTSSTDITLTTMTGISGYKLALEDGGSVISEDVSSVAPKWTLVNATASYFAQGTPAQWALGSNSTKIHYTAAVQDTVLAAITGLNSTNIHNDDQVSRYVNIAEKADGASKGTITLSNEALDRTSSTPISLVTGSKSYALTLAAGISKFDDNADTKIATLAMSGTSAARITREQAGGWLIADGASSISFKRTTSKLLASITGLSNGALESYFSIGEKVDKNSIITLQKFALGTNSAVDVVLKDEDTTDNFTFELSLSGGGSKLGFEAIDPYWSISGASAIYQKSTKEGWTLSGTSKIFYTPQEAPTMLATINNLSGITLDAPSNTIAGVTVSDNLITLARSVLHASSSPVIALKNGKSQTFSLSLAGGISLAPADLGNSLSIAKVTDGALSNSATIFKTYSEAWSVSGTSKIVYTGASSKTLATINGLSIAALGASDISFSGPEDNIIITLSQKALRSVMGNSGAVTLTDNDTTDNITFSLSLAAGVSVPDALTGNPYLSIVSGSGGTSTANIVHNRLAGWTLSGTSKIVYTGGTSITLATITGLSKVAQSQENIFLGAGVSGKFIITLDKGALIAASGTSVVLTDSNRDDGFDFSLALSGGVSSPGTVFENWSLSVVNGSASVIADKHEGWTLSGESNNITYTPKEIGILAKIAGLSSKAVVDTNISLEANGASDTSIITLKTGALIAASGTSVVLTDNNPTDGFDFIFALSGVSSPATTFTNAKLNVSSVSSTGNASISGIKSAGWTLTSDETRVDYVAQSAAILGTVSGLSLGASTAIAFDDTTNVIKLKNGSLSQTSISLESDYDAFSLSLASDIAKYNDSESVGFRPIYYWEKNSGNTTAYYKVDTSEGWTLAGNSRSVNYTEESHDNKIVASITKLQGGISSASGVIEGISVSSIGGNSVITLSQNVLGVGDPMQLTNFKEFDGSNANYSLSLNADSAVAGGSVPQAGVSTFAWTTLGTTAKYSKIETAYWTLAENSRGVTYTPQKNNDTVATLTGLKNTVQATDMTVAGTSNADGKYEIKLDNTALNNRNVTLGGSSSYVLTLNRSTLWTDTEKKVDKPTLSGGKWTVNTAGTTATYTVTLTDGYEVSNDGRTVIHTTAGETALLTITGLKGGLTPNSYGEIIGIKVGTVDGEGKFTESKDGTVIQLSKDVLGTNIVAINGTGLGANYTLCLDAGVLTSTVEEKDFWRIVDDTTAVYKKIKPAYYTIGGDSKSIDYTAEKDTENGTRVTVTGLKSGLSVSEDGQWVGVANTKDGITTIAKDLVLTGSSGTGTITLTKNVLTNTDVKVTKGNATSDTITKYELTLTDKNSLKPALKEGNLSFVQDGTTKTKAYLKGTMGAGYLVDTDDNSGITYKAEDTAYTLATIEGLNDSLSSADFTGNNAGLKVAGTTITVNAKMLGDTNVTLTKGKYYDNTDLTTEYTFALGDDVVTNEKATDTKVWVAGSSSGTYTYKTIKPTHYDLESGHKTITRTNEADATGDATIVTLTGLKSDLVNADRQIDGITVTKDSDNPEKYNILLSGDVLNGEKGASYSNLKDGYSVDVIDAIKPDNSTPYWTVKDTTATYQYDTTAGYVVTAGTGTGTITYQAAKTPAGTTAATKSTAIVTITNLKSGLSTNARDEIDGITVDTTNNRVILSKDVLGTEPRNVLTLTNGKKLDGDNATYTLVLNGESFGKTAGTFIEDNTIDEDATGWTINSTGDAILKSGSTSGYTINNTGTNKTITYSKATLSSTVLATVKNLKSGITANDEFQINGITVDKTAKTITLSKDVLGTDATKNVTVVESGDYTLALNTVKDDPGYVAEPKYTTAWKLPSKGTATFTETTTEGYQIKSSEVVYTPKRVVTSKITGLNTSLKVDDLKNSIIFEITDSDDDGIPDVETDGDNKDKNTGEFFLKKSAFITGKNSTVKLANDSTYGAYTLGLSGVEEAESDANAPKWKKTNTDTKATYTVTTKPGLTISENQLEIRSSITETYNHLATLTGLKKDVAATADGELAGVEIGGTSSNEISLSSDILATSNVTVTGKTIAGDEYILKLNEIGTNSAADPDNVMDAKWYEVQYAEPTLSYNKTKNTVSIIGGKTAGWEAHRKTEGAGTATTADDKYDDKTIYYTAAKPETIATISGLKINKDNTVTGLKIDAWTRKADTGTGASAKDGGGDGQIHLTKDSLNKKDVKVTVPDALKETYKFSFETEGDISAPEDKERFWTSDGSGNVAYKYKTTEGYKLNDDKNTLTYSTEVTTTLAKITGLKNVAKITDETTTSITGITIPEDYELKDGEVNKIGKLQLNDREILGDKVGNKIKLTSDYYNFELADALKTKEAGNPQWYISGTTATLKNYKLAGYEFTGTGTNEFKIVEYKKDTATDEIVKITGLKKNLKADKINEDKLLAINGALITPDASVLGTGTITLTNGDKTPTEKYTYKFDVSAIAKPTAQTPVWKFSNGTATLKQTTTAGYTSSENDTKLTYSSAKTPTVATVKGLNTKLKVTKDGELGLATGTKTGSKTVYSLIGEAAITFDGTVITVNEDALNKKTISVSGTGGYKLAFGNLTTNTEKKEATEWTVSGTTGTYKDYEKDYYTIDSSNEKITYTKATKGKTYATVTGLKKNTSAADLNANWVGDATGGVLTLNQKQLGTSTVKIATTLANTENKDGFTLALSTSTAEGEAVTRSEVTGVGSATANKSGKAILKGTLTKGYSLSFGNKSITYLKENKSGQTIATVTGLASGKSISADADGVITLTADKFNKKDVTVTTSRGNIDYKLSFDDSSTTPEFDTETTTPKEPGWTNPSGTATLKGYVATAGYIASKGGKAIIYTAATATKNKSKADSTQVYKSIGNLATIKGIASGKEPSISDDTIVVDGNKTSGNLTVNGGAFKVEVRSNFENRSITGSTKADQIEIAGTGVSVTGGKGNDYIDLGNKNNRFIYSNGDGDDVIANFTAGKDTLQVKSGTPVVGRTSDNDILVKVGSGSIKLLDTANVTELTVIGKNDNTTKTYSIPTAETNSGYLLADDNYSTSAAQLSDIVKGDSATYTPYEFNSSFSLTKEETFTPTTTSNGSSKKK